MAVDQELATALKRAKGSPMFFALVVKGGSDGALVISKQKVPADAIAAAKKKSGGTAVVKGRCFGEDDKLIFESPKPPAPTWEKIVKKLAKEEAGLMIHPEFRQGGEDEDEGGESQSQDTTQPPQSSSQQSSAPPVAPPPPPQPSGPDAEYRKKLAVVTPLAKRALTEKHPAAAQVADRLRAAQAAATAGDFPRGVQELIALERLLQPPPQQQPPTQEEQQQEQEQQQEEQFDPAAEYQSRVQKLTPALKEAIKKGGATGKLLTERFTASQAAAKNNEFGQANSLLDEVQSLMETAAAKAAAAMAAWHEAWQDAVEDIATVIEAVKEAKDPDAVKVELALKSIAKNLTKDPATPQAVTELRRYIETDDIITAAEEVPGEYGSLDLRGPLLAALSGFGN